MRGTPVSQRKFRSDEFWLGCLFIAGINVASLWFTAQQGKLETIPLLERSLVNGGIATVITGVFVVLAGTQARLEPEALLLKNHLTVTVVPFALIRRLTTHDGLRVELKDGSAVAGRVVPRSNGGRWSGYRTAKRIRRAVQPYLTPADPAPDGLQVLHQRRIPIRWLPLTVCLHASWYLLLRHVFVAR
ncbi:hypothetical protein J7E96_08730 [Streptomyces sp. ISL-96]|uniref:hypothetical protein n=1 Tax=Streptomyces sp. ISL-96 TaxID=2819191 RepID=UPI001BE59CBD|nr:hypothetical protein [Streptomyces sp. ISL-96]MBT2488608.1 hypothetical protein [Streptomyces sp. ISL-96]